MLSGAAGMELVWGYILFITETAQKLPTRNSVEALVLFFIYSKVWSVASFTTVEQCEFITSLEDQKVET